MKFYIAGFIAFIFLVWFPVEAAWSAYCFNNYDLGIYSQAIHELSLSNLNPWLSVRDLFLFNDHFEPVFFLLQPFKTFLPESLLAIRVDMLALLIASTAPIWLARRRIITIEVAVCAAAIILFSPLTLDAAYYPAHPGTWSLAPMAWMFAFFMVGKDRSALLMLFMLFWCKEEYPVIGLVLGAALYVSGRKRPGIICVIISALWAFGVFVVRPWAIGPASLYTDAVSHGTGLQWFSEPGGFRKIATRHLELLAPLIVLLLKKKPDQKRPEILMPVGFVLTLLAIRLAGGFWDNHRVAPLSVSSAFIAIFWLRNQEIPKVRLKVFAICMLILSFPSLELGSRVWRGKPFKKHCPADVGRLASIRKAADYLRTRTNGVLLTQGNLIPPLIDLPGISHIGATRGKDFKFFMVEKNPNRNTWPLKPAEFAELEAAWRSSAAGRVIQDDEFLLLIEKL